MTKKIDFDNTIKKVESVANTVDIIMRNRLIVAIFLIVDGVTFILNPETTLSGMAQNIILLTLLATLSVFITNLAAKTKDIKTIIISAMILIVGGVLYFYPDLIAAYIQLLLSLFIIYDGIKNIARTLHLNKISRYTEVVGRKYHKYAHRKATSKKELEQREKFKEIDDNLDNGLMEQKNKLISPLENIVGKTSRFTVLYIITNVMTITLGVVLLVCPDISMTVWGLIFLYTGISNLAASVQSMNLIKKIKTKKFKEIIFDSEEKKTNKN